MRAEDFEFLYALEERYWWFVAMRRIADVITRKDLSGSQIRVLDAGCGSGYNLLHYARAGHDVCGFDVAAEAVQWVRAREIHKVAQASVTDIPFVSEHFDLVFSFDVLCQIPVEMARAGLREMARVMKPGASLFVRVPAYEWLRSSHDAELHTAHRFTLAELRQAIVESGLEPIYSTYANAFLFPVVLLRRFLKRFGIGAGTDVKPLPPGLGWVDPIFREILSTEAHFARAGFPLPFGLSAICCARKPA